MLSRVTFVVLGALVGLAFVSSIAWSHGGGLDGFGCHHNRKLGGYHCHRGPFAGHSFASKAEMLATFSGPESPAQTESPAQQFTGKVVGMTDGDTITVLHQGKPERIRLNGIDCPEKHQPFGKQAKRFASQLVYGKTVTVTVFEQAIEIPPSRSIRDKMKDAIGGPLGLKDGFLGSARNAVGLNE